MFWEAWEATFRHPLGIACGWLIVAMSLWWMAFEINLPQRRARPRIRAALLVACAVYLMSLAWEHTTAVSSWPWAWGAPERWIAFQWWQALYLLPCLLLSTHALCLLMYPPADDGGGGEDEDEDPQPPDPSDPEGVDWDRFQQDFWQHVDRERTPVSA